MTMRFLVQITKYASKDSELVEVCEKEVESDGSNLLSLTDDRMFADGVTTKYEVKVVEVRIYKDADHGMITLDKIISKEQLEQLIKESL